MLSAEQKQHFDEHGYVFIDPQIDTATLDGVVKRIGDDVLGARTKQVMGPDARPGSGRVQDAWLYDDAVRHIARAPAVMEALHTLYDRPVQPFQTLNFRIGTQQRTHSDTIHFNAEPAGFMCGVWTALEDIDERNGPVIYYPGSHKLPEATRADVYAEPDLAARRGPPYDYVGLSGLVRRLKGHPPKGDMYGDYPLYEDYIERQVQRHRLASQLATMRKGQAFVWAANLLHGGSPQLDPQRTRHSQVTHYYFGNCRYFRPLMTVRKHRYYYTPQWITPAP